VFLALARSLQKLQNYLPSTAKDYWSTLWHGSLEGWLWLARPLSSASLTQRSDITYSYSHARFSLIVPDSPQHAGIPQQVNAPVESGKESISCKAASFCPGSASGRHIENGSTTGVPICHPRLPHALRIMLIIFSDSICKYIERKGSPYPSLQLQLLTITLLPSHITTTRTPPMASPLEAANTTVIFGLLNVITAFAGADIASPNLIERITWPQRNASVSATSFLKTTFLLSAGGPLHKIILSALDSLHRHSLFKGVGKGHMLGTPFFPDTGLSYIMYPAAGQIPEQELVRNGLLVRTLKGMRECTETVGKPAFGEQATRQNILVTYLELMDAGNISSSGAITLDGERVRLKTILLVACTETPSMVLTFVAAMIWSLTAASVFLTPLMLKVLATFTTLARKDFTAYPKITTSVASIDFEF
jgi:hypothetical protein